MALCLHAQQFLRRIGRAVLCCSTIILYSRERQRANGRLLDQVRELILIRHYNIRTEQAYLQWIRLFILLHRKYRPRDMGAAEVTAFLSDLAGGEGAGSRPNVVPDTQAQVAGARSPNHQFGGCIEQ